MKICNKCRKEKSLDDFYDGTQRGKNGQVWKYKDSICKPCRRAYGTNRRKKKKQQIVNYLGGRCIDCDIVDIPDIYDTHHINPSTKEFSIAKSAGQTFNDKLKVELDKCILLCANCHRKRHAYDLIE